MDAALLGLALRLKAYWHSAGHVGLLAEAHHGKVKWKDAVVASSMLSVIYGSFCVDHGLHTTMLNALKGLGDFVIPMSTQQVGCFTRSALRGIGTGGNTMKSQQQDAAEDMNFLETTGSKTHRVQKSTHLYTQAVDDTQE